MENSPTASRVSSRRSLLLVLVALALALLAVMGAALSAQYNFSAMSELTNERAKARTVRLHLERVLSLFKDVETGARGFALTGESSYLDPYLAARNSLPAAYAELKQKFPAVPAAQAWSVLDQLVATRLKLAETLIEERRQMGAGVIADRHLLDSGQDAMSAIRVEFLARDRLMAARVDAFDAEVSRVHKSTVISAWTLAVATVVLVLLAVGLLLRERALRMRLEEDLRLSNRSLDERVRSRTAELAAARDRIAGFAGEQERLIEAERRRLSREVHDQIGQVFTAIRMIIRGLPADTLPASQLTTLDGAIDMGVATARRISAELRPPLLDDLGLQAALEHLAEKRLQPAGIAWSVALAEAELLADATALAIYRILQEACANTLQHAAAHRVDIVGRRLGNSYEIEMHDDGCGLADAGRQGALGIVGMQERAALRGGTVTVVAGEGGGVRVRISMPVQTEEGGGDEDSVA